MKQETPEEAARQRQEVEKAIKHLTEDQENAICFFINEIILKNEMKAKRCAA